MLSQLIDVFLLNKQKPFLLIHVYGHQLDLFHCIYKQKHVCLSFTDLIMPNIFGEVSFLKMFVGDTTGCQRKKSLSKNTQLSFAILQPHKKQQPGEGRPKEEKYCNRDCFTKLLCCPINTLLFRKKVVLHVPFLYVCYWETLMV